MNEKMTVVETCAICGDKFIDGAPVYTFLVRDGDSHKALKICDDCATNNYITTLASLSSGVESIYHEIEIKEEKNYV